MAWTRQLGTLSHISAGDDGEIWGLAEDGGIRRYNDGEWQPIPGSLRQLSVGSIDHLWGVNQDDVVFRWIGGWKQMPGRLRWVSAASDGTVVGVNADDGIFRWRGAAWEQLPGRLVQVSAASAKVIYGINRTYSAFRWNGSDWDGVSGARAITASVENGKPSCWGLDEFGKTRELDLTKLYFAERSYDPVMKQILASAQRLVGVRKTDSAVYSWGGPLPFFSRSLVMRQDGWRWCRNCQGLFYGGNATRGNCPSRPVNVIATAVSPHDSTGSGEYALATSTFAPGQAGWRWCRKCEGLFWGGSGAGGKCQSGGAHDSAGSGVYTLLHDDPAALGQDGFRYCKKCEGLFYAGGGATRCPAGQEHDGSASFAYRVLNLS